MIELTPRLTKPQQEVFFKMVNQWVERLGIPTVAHHLESSKFLALLAECHGPCK